MTAKAPRPRTTCPHCGRTSYHPKDIQYRYCGACGVFYTEEEQAYHAETFAGQVAAIRDEAAEIIHASHVPKFLHGALTRLGGWLEKRERRREVNRFWKGRR